MAPATALPIAASATPIITFLATFSRMVSARVASWTLSLRGTKLVRLQGAGLKDTMALATGLGAGAAKTGATRTLYRSVVKAMLDGLFGGSMNT